MEKLKYHEIINNPGIVPLKDIPVLDYQDFRLQTVSLLENGSNHCVNYFIHSNGSTCRFIILIASDVSHTVFVYSHDQKPDITSLDSISRACLPLHGFEREIHEKTGIIFEGHPWPKPIRYPYDRKDQDSRISGYPFYRIESEETHEVGVGPIHAGIIEPGHFRFECYGEKVLHLEIQLGYQHRGIESLFLKKSSLPERSVLSESIAGDTAIGHGLAFSQLAEILSRSVETNNLGIERSIALEMERMAVHIGDTAALCSDVAFQIGQAAFEALRTIVINTMQDWCGNRFSKGLIRPGGTYYPLSEEKAKILVSRLSVVRKRFFEAAEMIFNDAGVVTRFENTGTVSLRQASLTGAVGMAARSSGLNRDIRKSHPFQAYRYFDYNPVIVDSGDVLARVLLRYREFDQSYSVINDLISKIDYSGYIGNRPDYSLKFGTGLLGVSLVEGWRGEICHTAITGENGDLSLYKIKDPSFHNWQLLALAVRQQEISDFPVCNKSFNLSYCGHDL